jgi:hypothetical protein
MIGCCKKITILILISLCFFSRQAVGKEMLSPESQTIQFAEKGKGVEVPIGYGEGLPVSYVYVHLLQSTGDSAKDEQLRQQLSDMFEFSPGDHFSSILADTRLRRLQELPSVQSIKYRLYQSEPPGRLVVALLVEPAPEGHEERKRPSGMLVSGKPQDFPKLYESEGTLLTLILNGGIGAYSDTHPWFGKGKIFNRGSPIADKPAGPGTTSLMEAYIEPGLGGITRLGDTPFYPYGAVTYMITWSSGHDIYSSGSRTWGDFERAYGGFLYDLPGEKTSINVSYGRQDYQLRDGFLIATIPGSNDLAHRGALNLGPRNAYNRAGIGRLKVHNFSFEGILLEPDELRVTKTNTRLLGANLQYNFSKGIEAAFSYLYVPRSDKSYFIPGSVKQSREGLRTFNPALTINPLFGVKGLWLKGEYAYQDNEDFDMSANAYYGWIGYRAEKWPWRPGLSYRYAFFSGDDPTTQTYERFDPLFSGRSNFFLPGLISSKVITNSNLRTHRATFSVFPKETLEILLEYFNHSAQRLNNLGGIGPLQTLTSKNLIQELQFNVFWFIGKNWYFQGIATAGIPGKAIDRAVGGDAKNWYSLQASLYMFF